MPKLWAVPVRAPGLPSAPQEDFAGPEPPAVPHRGPACICQRSPSTSGPRGTRLAFSSALQHGEELVRLSSVVREKGRETGAQPLECAPAWTNKPASRSAGTGLDVDATTD